MIFCRKIPQMKFTYSLILTVLFLSIHSLIYSQNTGCKEWYLKTADSLDIFVKETGQGRDTVIMVHGGFGANHEYLTDITNGLNDQFHFILYDQRGSLLSPSNKEKLLFGRNVEDLYKLINELNISRANLFCHSMGTLVGMEFAERYPHRVKNLVLCASLPLKSEGIDDIFNSRYKQQVQFLQERDSVRQLLAPYLNKQGPDSSQIRYYNYQSELSDREQTELWRIQFASVNIYDISKWRKVKGGRAYYKQEAAKMANSVNWRYDYRKTLNSGMRTSVIMGDHDFVDFHGQNLKQQVLNYKNIEIEIIEDAGHNIWIDQPALFQKVFINLFKDKF